MKKHVEDLCNLQSQSLAGKKPTTAQKESAKLNELHMMKNKNSPCADFVIVEQFYAAHSETRRNKRNLQTEIKINNFCKQR